MKSILIVGGAGYIGSHMALVLHQANYDVVVLDNLSKGHRDAVLDAKLVVGDMADKKLLEELFATHSFSAVMHFASFIEVAESVKLPIKYYQNNVAATFNLLEVMLKHNIKHFIFSSTAAVFGEPQYIPIDEKHPRLPINPYGRSKWIIEETLKDLARSDDLHYAVLRYFNAAGSDPEKKLGERHEPESHLIPLVLQVAAGKRDHIFIYGDDYPTPDGTCVRDYVHVMDLCDAHLLALEALYAGKKNATYNLGTGHGYSVQQIIDTARRVTNHPIPTVVSARRPGDPAVLVADAKLAMQELGWKAKYNHLEVIIKHAWQFVVT